MYALLLRFLAKKILKSKVFWIAIITVPIVVIISTNIFFFFIFKMAVAKAESRAEEALKGAKDIVEIYSEDLLTDSLIEDPELIDEPEIKVPPKDDGKYDDTREEAENINGTSLLHELHNAIVDRVNQTDVPGYTYAYVLGTNYTESSGSGIPWMPWVSAPLQAMKEPGFNLKDWSYKDAVEWQNKVGFNLKSSTSYIGPFQIDYKDWNSSLGRPSKSWGLSQWEQFVTGAPASMDGSGDGVADVHNYYDSLYANARHATNKYNLTKQGLDIGQEGFEDMMVMVLASRYVGIVGRDDSKTTSGHTFKTYPYVEGYNPHVDLMRAAYEEAKNNGPHYSKVKSIMEGMTSTSPNNAEINSVIDNFYLANGWVKSNGGFKKNYRDGGSITIRGPGTNSTQDIAYPFKVYWSGKIGEENIIKTLQETGN